MGGAFKGIDSYIYRQSIESISYFNSPTKGIRSYYEYACKQQPPHNSLLPYKRDKSPKNGILEYIPNCL